MRFKVTTLVKLSGNFSLKKPNVPETCLSILLPHLREPLWVFFSVIIWPTGQAEIWKCPVLWWKRFLPAYMPYLSM